MATTSSSSIEIVNPFQEVVPFSVSAASSSAPPSLPSTSFDVFINHCGADVKYTLATNIHDKLSALGLSVFLDVLSLQLGDVIPAQIEEAIRTASLHIAIFSINYAKSPWCLAELSSMLKTGNRIIPVFYHVDPSDLRWVGQGNGIYAPAFSQYQEKGRYSTKLDEWKIALENVSVRSGCVIKDNKDEGMQLKNIVNMVSKELGKVPFLVADKPVGLDDIVRDFEESVESEPNVQIVGIVGMGGAGKTTLAKELFNRKSSSFQYSSIVFSVRDAASRNDLHEKQKRLLEDLGVRGSSFDNIERGKAILANRLRSVRALIVLDDVDHRSQLDALLPSKDWIASGSLVIVTTRELHLLANWGSTIYRMKPLNAHHAKQLFCWHAFLQSFPKEGFEKIVEKFFEACSGLPLSLEVFGGLVYGKSKEFWESQLDKISRMLPEDIKGRLNVSYNALDGEEKEMFMDVACFFIGKKKSWAIEVWDGSGWSGLHGWETLVNKCLVNVDGYDDIMMHDHLRDLGRDLAGRSTPCRVWHPDQIIDIKRQTTVVHSGGSSFWWLTAPFFSCLLPGLVAAFHNEIQGGMSIRGIDCARFEYTDEPLRHRQCLKKLFELIGISNRCFWSPPPALLGLKLFTGREEHFIKNFGAPSEDPVCLSFDHFKGRKLQSWSLRNLRILEVTYADGLRELWDNSDPPLQLRELSIGLARELQRIPTSIGRLKELKRIDLSDCSAIKNLPEEFCGLQSLEWLRLYNFLMLSSLPTHMGDLINLRLIDLGYCERLQMLPDSFKQLRHLQHLNLYACKELTLRSDMLENISNLKHLNLEGCRKLEQLPNQITHQVCLRELCVGSTGIREVPSDIGELRKLELLKIGSPFLASLPSSLGNLSSLARLSISSDVLTSLPSSLGNLSSLTELAISSPLLTSLPSSLGNLSSLTGLGISGPLLTSLPSSFEDLSRLTKLNLENCEMLNSLPDFVGALNMLKRIRIHSTRVSTISMTEDSCPSLKTLILSNNDHLLDIQTLPTSVRRLLVFDSRMLKKIIGLHDLENLQFLTIRFCPELDELPSFADLNSLKEFTIEKCDKVGKIEGLQHSRSLEKLEAVTSWKSAGIQSLEGMEKLKRLIMVAENRSALQPCIQTIKKWPGEMVICGRAVSGAESIMGSLSFPTLTIFRSFTKLRTDVWSVECGKTHNSEAAVVCFLVNSFADSQITIFFGGHRSETTVRVREGKWVLVGVMRQDCAVKVSAAAALWDGRGDGQGEVKRGMLLAGEGGRVLEAFTNFWALFI